ncbi:MAG TPA: inositol-3-phosphate synthase [Lacipirellulaceae bacterium]|jgi:myo-inositol-1-phosphate synthase|nr:inositol-3-phosphate synthase [Lacipirellulaceae bacterium]
MSPPRIGCWFIGARGGVAASATLGLIALQKGLTDSIGLVSELPQFTGLDLLPWDSFVVGGHEIRSGSIAESLERLHKESRVFDTAIVTACEAELKAADSRIRGGTLANCGSTISGLACPNMQKFAAETATDTIKRLQSDLKAFQEESKLDRVIVVNVSSTEPANESLRLPERWEELDRQLKDKAVTALPASSLYAIAAFDLGMAYVNFTPSLGASPAAIQDLAKLRGTCTAGQDGKTGETLLKSVLAPMFAARHLEVLSWVGHNIFGNLDGVVLDDPANKASKVKSKNQLVKSILGYDPQTLVSIEYIRSLGDWKTAWDHIHFKGFLGTLMTLQLTWQGCDSLLAAPLVLDLVRFVELSRRKKEVGVLPHLGSFFKSPLGLEEHDFSRQFILLCDWAQRHAKV